MSKQKAKLPTALTPEVLRREVLERSEAITVAALQGIVMQDLSPEEFCVVCPVLMQSLSVAYALFCKSLGMSDAEVIEGLRLAIDVAKSELEDIGLGDLALPGGPPS